MELSGGGWQVEYFTGNTHFSLWRSKWCFFVYCWMFNKSKWWPIFNFSPTHDQSLSIRPLINDLLISAAIWKGAVTDSNLVHLLTYSIIILLGCDSGGHLLITEPEPSRKRQHLLRSKCPWARNWSPRSSQWGGQRTACRCVNVCEEWLYASFNLFHISKENWHIYLLLNTVKINPECRDNLWNIKFFILCEMGFFYLKTLTQFSVTQFKQ